ncbi:CinA family protein [Kytococcus sp. Marseille-QA3725]
MSTAPSEGAAARLVAELTRRGQTVAVAESLTGGLVTADLTSVPGASVVVRGGVVSYATELKAEALGVDPDRLAATGPVDGVVAEQMAAGVARWGGADWGVSTTGVAGPGPADGHPAGTVHVGVAGEHGTRHRAFHLPGDRAAVRRAAVDAALAELLGQLDSVEPLGESRPDRPTPEGDTDPDPRS